MADEEQVKILKEKNHTFWNSYRKMNPDVIIDLTHVDLTGINLSEYDLREAVFFGSTLNGADLNNARLFNANMSNANMIYTNLSNANLSNAIFHDAQLEKAIFHNAKLYRTDMINANLEHTDFREANISGAILAHARNLTQLQIDQTTFLKSNPPTIPTFINFDNFTDGDVRKYKSPSRTPPSEGDLDHLSDKNVFSRDDFFKPVAVTETGETIGLMTGSIDVDEIQSTSNVSSITDKGDGTIEVNPTNSNSPFDVTIKREFGPSEVKTPDYERSTPDRKRTSQPGIPTYGQVGINIDTTINRTINPHPSDRIILSGQLSTPGAVQRRTTSDHELSELKDFLEHCEVGIGEPGENIRRLPMEQEQFELIKTVVITAIELQKAPNYPEGIINALLGMQTIMHTFKETTDWAPLPKALSDRIGNTINAYDAFLEEIGLS